MLPHCRTILLSAAALLPALAAADTYTVYLPEGADTPELRRLVEKRLPSTPEAPATCDYVVLKYNCTNMNEAEIQAQAMEAGVTHLPCLVVSDDKGPYAALLLRRLTKKAIEDAVVLAIDKEREQQAEKRRYEARQYRLFARCRFESDEQTLPELIHECRMLMEHERCDRHQQQLLGLRCLYPLLMKQYTLSYKGAHTPASEAKLLEAIAALEAARDLAPNSELGKRAHDERHRLRMARREARKYE